MKRVWDIAGKELLQKPPRPLGSALHHCPAGIFTVFLGLLIPNEDDTSRLPLALADADGSQPLRSWSRS